MSKDTAKTVNVENRTTGIIVLDISADEALKLKPGVNPVDSAAWTRAMSLKAAKSLTVGDRPSLTASLPVG